MFAQQGPDHEFSGDAIWEYADEEVPWQRKSPVFKTLTSIGYLIDTGEITKSVTPNRRSSTTTKYRFGPLLTSTTGAALPELPGAFAAACGDVLRVDESTCIRLCASLLSKRFLIVTGLAGSGKTMLAQAFARWITPRLFSPNLSTPKPSFEEIKYYEIIPVGADWSSNENVLGYPNGLNASDYVSKPALDLMLHALDFPKAPHFLILDEMNLSHVERYFADLLSAIESGEEIRLHLDTDRRANGKPVPSKLAIPKNFFIVGTVNVDETTYMFSPKVLDRANVIEFRMEEQEMGAFLRNPLKPELARLDGKGDRFGRSFTAAATEPASVPDEVKAAYESEMLLFFNALRGHGAEFGYRVAHEAARFIHFYNLLGKHPNGDTGWFSAAFDCVIVQKFLPKLHGSRAKLGPLLKKLWFLCAQDPKGRGLEPLESAEKAARATQKGAEPAIELPAGAPYRLSAEKIGRMWRLLNENGFASFAEA